MHVFEKTLFNAMLPIFERALADAAKRERALPAPVSAPVPVPVNEAACSPAPQLPRAA